MTESHIIAYQQFIYLFVYVTQIKGDKQWLEQWDMRHNRNGFKDFHIFIQMEIVRIFILMQARSEIIQ